MSVTVYQIAKASGVSQPTVSRILNQGGQQFKPETCERVLATAQRLGYRPNRYARAIRQGRFHSVSLVTIGKASTTLPEAGIYAGAYEALDAKGLQLTLLRMAPEAFKQDELPAILQEGTSDGMLFYGSSTPTAEVQELFRRFKVPAIWVGQKLKADCIYPDEAGGAAEAVQRLVRLGHRRIAYCTMDASQKWEVGDRVGGYRQAMNEAGLEPIVRPLVDENSASELLPRARAVLRSSDRPTAVLCYYEEARRMYGVAGELGLKVPDDLSIIAFERLELSTDLGQRISSMHMSMTSIGRAAVAMLMEKITAPETELAPQTERYQFIDGQTCASAPVSNF